MIVVDASALIETLLHTDIGELVEGRILSSQQKLVAPHLVDAECAQVIRRHVARGVVVAERGRIAIGNLAVFPIRRYAHSLLLPRVWELRHNLTAYDAFYIALAELLDAPLLTLDRRLASAAGHYARVEVV